MKEVDAAEKSLQLYFGVWLRSVQDGGDLCRKRRNALPRDLVAEKCDQGLTETALVSVNGQAIGCQPLVDGAEVLEMR